MIPVNEDLIVNAVQKVSRSVVNIASVRTVHDQLFRVFPVEGVGSGVIIDWRCHVLNNNHVVDEAQKLKITLTDGSIFDGKVIGTDETTDLAVVKLDSTETLPFAALGNSDDLRIGQVVIAIGNPFALTGGPTVTAGIVSSFVKITRQLAQYYRLPATEGVLIAQVESHSPADDAGLRKGDIIEAVDSKRIDDTTEISINVRKKTLSDKLTMTINRYGRRFEVPIQLQARP